MKNKRRLFLVAEILAGGALVVTGVDRIFRYGQVGLGIFDLVLAVYFFKKISQRYSDLKITTLA